MADDIKQDLDPVKNWLLSNELSETSISKLLQSGYDKMQFFTVCTHDDIDEIVKECSLSKNEKLKLKCAVNKLLEVKTDKLPIIDPEETEAMSAMQHRLKLLEETMCDIASVHQHIDEQHHHCQRLIDDTFQHIEHSLHERQQALQQKLQRMVRIKQTILSTQRKEIEEAVDTVTDITQQCHRLLSSSASASSSSDSAQQMELGQYDASQRKTLILSKQKEIHALALSNHGKPKVSSSLCFDIEPSYKHLLHSISKFGTIASTRTSKSSQPQSQRSKIGGKMNKIKSHNSPTLAAVSESDEWDSQTMGDNVRVTKNGKRIVCNEQQSYCYRSGFGRHTHSTGCHHWRLKIVSYHHAYCAWNMLVGVMKLSSIASDGHKMKSFHRNSHFTAKDSGYGFVGNLSHLTTEHGMDREYGAKFAATGDVIDVYLDLERRELAYKINGVGYGIAYDDLQESAYCLAVTFCGNKNELEMIAYDQQTYK